MGYHAIFRVKVAYTPSDVDKGLRSGNDFIEEDASKFNFISVAYFDLPFRIGYVNYSIWLFQ